MMIRGDQNNLGLQRGSLEWEKRNQREEYLSEFPDLLNTVNGREIIERLGLEGNKLASQNPAEQGASTVSEEPSSTKPKSYADKIKTRLSELKPLHENQPLLTGLDMTEQARPEVIILTKLSEEALDHLVDIQDGLIRLNPSLKHTRISREKMHITVLALYEETNLEQLFNETMDEATSDADISIELDGFRDFNRRIVIQLKPGVLHDLSKLFMYNCASRSIQYDALQTPHVSLFKPKGKHTCSSPNEPISKYTSMHNHPLRIKNIAACKLLPGMPELMGLSLTHNEDADTSRQQRTCNNVCSTHPGGREQFNITS
jgi:2'-5' RNA ligase